MASTRKRSLIYNGFVMIEVMLAISIAAVVAQFILSSLMVMRYSQRVNLTEQHSDIVFRALAAYVLRHGCLPYPAKSDGEEFEPVENEEVWKTSSECSCGIVPYKTLGIDEKYAKDGYGYYFTYVVNPTLCKRKDVESVPLNDPREYLDFRKDVNFRVNIVPDHKTFVPIKGQSSRQSEMGIDSAKYYSSYRSVRSYIQSYNEDDTFDDGETKTWDIVARIDNAQIKCVIGNKEVECNEVYFLIPNQIYASELPQYKNPHAAKTAESAVQSIRMDQRKSKYMVQNCIAIVLISHGKHGKGSINKDNVIISSKNAAPQRINGRTCDITPRSDGSKGFWVSRFGLLSKFTNLNCVPDQIRLV